MKHVITRVLLLGSFASLFASCTANDAQQPNSPAQSKVVATVAQADEPLQVRVVRDQSKADRSHAFSGEHVNGVTNLFPTDTPNDGRPVPQMQGQDRRAPVPVVMPPVPAEMPKGAYATAPPSGTLVLYDNTGPYAWLGELYGIASAALASHFGTTKVHPVATYVAGEMANYTAVIYNGSTYDQALPVAFLDDVLASTIPVVWIYDNIWQLNNRSTGFYAKYGFTPWIFDVASVAKVNYKGVALDRDATNACGIMTYSPIDNTRVTTLATAVKADGTTIPWAIRGANITYIGEIPYAYIGHDDRYLAFADILMGALAPNTVTRHRALVRLEDVSPAEDPAELNAITNFLYANNVPFSVAVIPQYTDSLGAYNGKKALTVKLTDRPLMVSALKYAASHGGKLIMHGFTHQYGKKINPYSGCTGDDFEFFFAHVDTLTNNVIYDGAVTGDSTSWALGRINSGISAMTGAGLTSPTVFEFPHYAGSPVDAKAIRTKFATAYHRGLYFSGALGFTPQDMTHSIGLFYPYSVTDVYGFNVKPENIGNYEPDAYNNHPPRLPRDLIKSAQNNLVIRDGVASFFFHPYYPLNQLTAIVNGIKAAGYTFVSIDTL